MPGGALLPMLWAEADLIREFWPSPILRNTTQITIDGGNAGQWREEERVAAAAAATARGDNPERAVQQVDLRIANRCTLGRRRKRRGADYRIPTPVLRVESPFGQVYIALVDDAAAAADGKWYLHLRKVDAVILGVGNRPMRFKVQWSFEDDEDTETALINAANARAQFVPGRQWDFATDRWGRPVQPPPLWLVEATPADAARPKPHTARI